MAVLYEEQATGPQLTAWFSDGVLVHNLPAVLATLAHRLPDSSLWPVVLDTLPRLLRDTTPEVDLPRLLIELPVSCRRVATPSTPRRWRAILERLPERPSATRSQALRCYGVALLGVGQLAAGLALLDRAIAMAAHVHSPEVGASALCHRGLSTAWSPSSKPAD